ncbi:MAG: aminopeptidase P family protein [Elusimicrobiota bacterium]
MKMYAEHRAALMRRLPDGLILLSGGREVPRNGDVAYVFRQKSDFLYLSGVEEPGCHLLIDPRRRRGVLFVPRVDTRHRVWLGHIPGPAEARRLFGIRRVAHVDALPAAIKKDRRGYRKAYADKEAWRQFEAGLRGLKNEPATLRDALEELRAVKAPEELKLMAEASRVSARAHLRAMKAARAGMRECQVQAVFEAECLNAGLRHLAFPTIVAAGANSAVLHYRRNDTTLRDGQLLLVDGGAEVKGYAGDITRTFPVGRRFTRRQRDIYSIVLETQTACIGKARAGITSADLHILSMRAIAEGLKSIGLLKGGVDGLVEGGAVRLFYPHGLGHLLGLDVHDGKGGRRRRLPDPTKIPLRFVAKLEPGFVMTIEPGVYFIGALLNDPALRRKHRGSVDFRRAEGFLDFGGVRIEDDIVILPKGPPKNLTRVPKRIEEIEAIRERQAGG